MAWYLVQAKREELIGPADEEAAGGCAGHGGCGDNSGCGNPGEHDHHGECGVHGESDPVQIER